MDKKTSGVSHLLARFRGWIQAGATLLTNIHLLITADGARFLGNERIPYHPKDVEAYMAENKQ